jgi:hypothetical protein
MTRSPETRTSSPTVRKGQGDVKLSREEFAARLAERFYDPAFDAVRAEIDRIIEVAWKSYDEYHKDPRERKAGPGFAEPEFELPVEWLATHDAVVAAERHQRDPATPRRILLVCGAARHDETCPGEMSKTFRLVQLAREIVEASEGFEADHGKKPEEAKALELAGWDYPKHLAGRAFGVVVHGDAEGAETLKRNLTDWLLDMDLVEAGNSATLDRYIGYYEPYATSHDALDRDVALHEEVRNVARTLVNAVRLIRSNRFERPDKGLRSPRPK